MATTVEDLMYEMAMEEKYREEYEQDLINKAAKELSKENTFLERGTSICKRSYLLSIIFKTKLEFLEIVSKGELYLWEKR